MGLTETVHGVLLKDDDRWPGAEKSVIHQCVPLDSRDLGQQGAVKPRASTSQKLIFKAVPAKERSIWLLEAHRPFEGRSSENLWAISQRSFLAAATSAGSWRTSCMSQRPPQAEHLPQCTGSLGPALSRLCRSGPTGAKAGPRLARGSLPPLLLCFRCTERPRTVSALSSGRKLCLRVSGRDDSTEPTFNSEGPACTMH